MSKFLNREAILNCEDVKTIEVHVPEWGGDVLVKMMTGSERDAFEASIINLKGSSGASSTVNVDNVRAKFIQKTVVDPDTKEPMFSVGDIDALGKKSAAALDRVYTAASKLNRVSNADVEDLVKNS